MAVLALWIVLLSAASMLVVEANNVPPFDSDKMSSDPDIAEMFADSWKVADSTTMHASSVITHNSSPALHDKSETVVNDAGVAQEAEDGETDSECSSWGLFWWKKCNSATPKVTTTRKQRSGIPCSTSSRLQCTATASGSSCSVVTVHEPLSTTVTTTTTASLYPSYWTSVDPAMHTKPTSASASISRRPFSSVSRARTHSSVSMASSRPTHTVSTHKPSTHSTSMHSHVATHSSPVSSHSRSRPCPHSIVLSSGPTSSTPPTSSHAVRPTTRRSRFKASCHTTAKHSSPAGTISSHKHSHSSVPHTASSNSSSVPSLTILPVSRTSSTKRRSPTTSTTTAISTELHKSTVTKCHSSSAKAITSKPRSSPVKTTTTKHHSTSAKTTTTTTKHRTSPTKTSKTVTTTSSKTSRIVTSVLPKPHTTHTLSCTDKDGLPCDCSTTTVSVLLTSTSAMSTSCSDQTTITVATVYTMIADETPSITVKMPHETLHTTCITKTRMTTVSTQSNGPPSISIISQKTSTLQGSEPVSRSMTMPMNTHIMSQSNMPKAVSTSHRDAPKGIDKPDGPAGGVKSPETASNAASLTDIDALCFVLFAGMTYFIL